MSSRQYLMPVTKIHYVYGIRISRKEFVTYLRDIGDDKWYNVEYKNQQIGIKTVNNDKILTEKNFFEDLRFNFIEHIEFLDDVKSVNDDYNELYKKIISTYPEEAGEYKEYILDEYMKFINNDFYTNNKIITEYPKFPDEIFSNAENIFQLTHDIDEKKDLIVGIETGVYSSHKQINIKVGPYPHDGSTFDDLYEREILGEYHIKELKTKYPKLFNVDRKMELFLVQNNCKCHP